jgi:tRNA G10  N-methylase Trm11
MTVAPVLAATEWRSNAELIADCVRLGYLREEWATLDPTYGRGVWWNVWRPPHLVVHDIELDGVDFRHLPEPDATFDAVAFDPPYVCVGGRTTTTLPDFHARFGLTNAPRTPAALQEMNDAGLAEMHRVLRPRGVLLVKCKDYVWSSRIWLGTHLTLTRALGLGFELVDRFEHIGRPNPQPERSRADGKPAVQKHARRNLSTLFVLRKGRA